MQLELVSSLEAEIQKRQQEEQRRMALEKALAGPLASGRVTLDNGKIGISGNVPFAPNADKLQPEGQQLLKSLAPPIAAYLGASEQMLMVSDLTDDKPVGGSNRQFADNWARWPRSASTFLETDPNRSPNSAVARSTTFSRFATMQRKIVPIFRRKQRSSIVHSMTRPTPSAILFRGLPNSDAFAIRYATISNPNSSH